MEFKTIRNDITNMEVDKSCQVKEKDKDKKIVQLIVDIENPDYEKLYDELKKKYLDKKFVAKLLEHTLDQKSKIPIVKNIYKFLQTPFAKMCMNEWIARNEWDAEIKELKITKLEDEILQFKIKIDGLEFIGLKKIISDVVRNKYVDTIIIPAMESINESIPDLSIKEEMATTLMTKCNHGVCEIINDFLAWQLNKKQGMEIQLKIKSMRLEFVSYENNV